MDHKKRTDVHKMQPMLHIVQTIVQKMQPMLHIVTYAKGYFIIKYTPGLLSYAHPNTAND